MNTMDKEKCSNCHYYICREGNSKTYVSRCRRYPPILINDSESTFPWAYADDWCGEYHRKGHCNN